jgi:hypothetical protein
MASVPGFRRRPAGGRHPQKRRSSPEGARRDRCWLGSSCLGLAILRDPARTCATHPGGASPADGWPPAVVLVVGGDVADRGVQSPGVVVGPDPSELAVEDGRVGDAGEVRPVALQMAEEALDVRLDERCQLRSV